MIDFILHISEHLEDFLNNYGSWIYALLFLIIFCETGLVATPFLPGDSMLFTAGSLCAIGDLNVHFLFILLTVAAIFGDGVNFYIGQFFGEKLFKNPNSKIFKQSYLRNTEKFYEKYGGKTIIIARFVPIIRTFAPFVAGMGKMDYARFLKFNVIGGIFWVALFCYMGYYFGQMEVVKNNLALVLIAIIIISVIPAIVEVIKIYRENKNNEKLGVRSEE